MANLYIITGPAGIGKSTVSKKIAKSKNKSVLIEGDEIYHQVISSYVSAWKEGNHLDVFWDVCISSIKTYLSYGYDVVFNYIITPDILERLKKEFKEYTTKFVVLLSDEETLLKRDKQRPEDYQMNQRCLILLNSFKNKDYKQDNILDTTNLSIEDTVNIINTDNRFIM